MKIVINKCYGGFHPSKEAILEMMRLGCPHIKKSPLEQWKMTFMKESEQELRNRIENFYEYPIVNDEVVTEEHRNDNRTCPILIKVVETLGQKVNSKYSDLKVVEIPDGIEYDIDEYDGIETVEEKHRSWG